MRLKSLLAGALAIAAMTAASVANAELVPVTVTGNSENINDQTGVFGPANQRITDLPFIETILINTEVGIFGPGIPVSVGYNDIFDPADGPYAVSASLTINGKSFSTLGDNYSGASIIPGSQYFADSANLPSSGTNSANQFISLEIDGANLPSTLSQSFFLSGTGSTATGSYVLTTAGGADDIFASFIDGITAPNGDVITNAQGTLFPTSITFGTMSAAPEPSVWALMIAGLGGMGVLFRRRRLIQVARPLVD